MASQFLKRSVGPLGVLGIIANFGYHHQNYLKSFFIKQEPSLPDPSLDFELPADFEKEIDSYCDQIEKSLSKYKKTILKNGVEVHGNFKIVKESDRPEGTGVISVPERGFKMIGKFSNGQLDGAGMMIDEMNQWSYKGNMWNGTLSGLGVLRKDKEFIYKGNFEKSKPKGSGKYLYDDGKKCVIEAPGKPDRQKDYAVCFDENKIPRYAGEWENENFNGKGTFYFSDGTRYEGDFENGQMHGYGTLFDKHGDVQYRGKFKEDERQETLNYYSEPLVIAGIIAAYIITKKAL